jgi:hypothetical protein
MASQPLRHLHTTLGCLYLYLPLPSASASAFAFHYIYLCQNNYLVVLNSVYIIYCFFLGYFNLFLFLYFQFCFTHIVDIFDTFCTLLLLSSMVYIYSFFLFIEFNTV